MPRRLAALVVLAAFAPVAHAQFGLLLRQSGAGVHATGAVTGAGRAGSVGASALLAPSVEVGVGVARFWPDDADVTGAAETVSAVVYPLRGTPQRPATFFAGFSAARAAVVVPGPWGAPTLRGSTQWGVTAGFGYPTGDDHARLVPAVALGATFDSHRSAPPAAYHVAGAVTFGMAVGGRAWLAFTPSVTCTPAGACTPSLALAVAHGR